VKHRTIPDAEACRNVRSVENGTYLIHREVSHELLLVSFGGYCLDLAYLGKSRRLLELGEAHERLDGGETGVAGSRAVPSLLLEMDEEGEDQGSVEVLQGQARGFRPETLTGKEEQQPERVSVCLAGVGAATAFDGEVLS
jgi:hypothetical protein